MCLFPTGNESINCIYWTGFKHILNPKFWGFFFLQVKNTQFMMNEWYFVDEILTDFDDFHWIVPNQIDTLYSLSMLLKNIEWMHIFCCIDNILEKEKKEAETLVISCIWYLGVHECALHSYEVILNIKSSI